MNRFLLPLRRYPALLLALLAAAPARAQIADTPETFDYFGSKTAVGDFDGDGYDDLAISAPYEDIGTGLNEGAVHVLYGTPVGLNDGDDQFWTQDSPGLGDAAEQQDRFGSALAVGDLDGDGYDDLAIGSPYEGQGVMYDVGQVHVLYGSAAGLTGSGSFYAPFVASAQSDYLLGWSLAIGDFDGDGYADLAVGGPGRDFGSVEDGGLVVVAPGSPAGISATNYRVWHQNTPGIADAIEAGDEFGSALAAGDFNDDGRDDLAIGVPNEDVEGLEDAGAAHVLYGSAVGLAALGDQLWSQATAGVEGDPEDYDRFGSALAAGDFDGDGRDDLAVGVPFESVGSLSAAGAVNVLYAAAAGLAVAGDQIWYQDVGAVADASEEGDYFGITLAAEDLDGDGHDDLAIGATFEDMGGEVNTGVVHVLYGTAAGLDDAGNQLWWQGSPDVIGDPEYHDRFGFALAAGDFDASGAADLAVGVVNEDVGATGDAGAVNVLYGSGSGLSDALNQILHQGLNLRVAGPGADAATTVALTAATTEAFGLLPAAPNPFVTTTTLSFTLPATGAVHLAVYDLLGREVALLHDGERAAGAHEATLDASWLPSGVYLLRLTAGGRTATQRLTIAR